MKQYEMVEIGKFETTVNKAFVVFGKKGGYNPRMDKNTLKTYITINDNKYVLGNYVVCKNGMILGDLIKVN